MTVTMDAIHDVQMKIEPIIGKKAWGVSLGIGSFIILKFGAEMQDQLDPNWIHGEWQLWITHCAWRLEKGEEVIAGSEDDRGYLKETLHNLEGLVLASTEFTPPAWTTTFTFDGDFTLKLFPHHTKEYNHWMLSFPDGNVLTLGPGTSWWYESDKLPPRM